MLVNNNWLKGGGVVPGWLTGKLSDFAFLVVAPVLLACLLPCRLPFRRTVAFAAVSATYVAADLSPAASDAIVALAGRMGLRWRLWPDVTDLLALLVLPVSWRLAGRRSSGTPVRRVRVLETVGVGVGALACLATSAPPTFDHHPFFLNQTTEPRAITVTRLLKRTTCGSDVAQVASGLTRDDLSDPHSETVASGQVAALDGLPTDQSGLAGRCSVSKPRQRLPYDYPEQDCSVAVVSVADGPAVLVLAPRTWYETESSSFFQCGRPEAPKSECQATMSVKEDPGPDALSLRTEQGRLVWKAGENLRIAEVDLAAIVAKAGDGTGCRSQIQQMSALFQSSTDCVKDEDCHVVRASLAAPFELTCDVYVNRRLSFGVLAAQLRHWDETCVAMDMAMCGPDPVQTPVCRDGKCAETCPGEKLPACQPLCSVSNNGAPTALCTDYTATFCYRPDGQVCPCAGAGSACSAPHPFSNTCPLACAAYRPISSVYQDERDAGARIVDGGKADRGQAMDGLSSEPDGEAGDAL
jgi:hypothetical protein